MRTLRCHDQANRQYIFSKRTPARGLLSALSLMPIYERTGTRIPPHDPYHEQAPILSNTEGRERVSPAIIECQFVFEDFPCGMSVSLSGVLIKLIISCLELTLNSTPQARPLSLSNHPTTYQAPPRQPPPPTERSRNAGQLGAALCTREWTGWSTLSGWMSFPIRSVDSDPSPLNQLTCS